MSKITNSVTHRTDIQLLRGVAVVAVIFFHAFERLLPGGFLGVDIFFVISGFVVSPLIQKIFDEKIVENRRTLLKQFYTARIFRLMPAFFVSLSISIFLVLLLASPSEHLRFIKQCIASFFLLGNFGAYGFNGDYFSPNPNPWVHTWSLAVEEQIYLFLPMMLYLFWGLIYRVSYGRIIFTFTTLSFGLFIFAPQTSPIFHLVGILDYQTFIFYSPLHRFWQFGVGAIFSIYQLRNKAKKSSWLGLLSIVLMIFMFIEVQSPGITSAVLISLLTILFLRQNISYIYKTLVVRFLVWSGDRSYSLYLVHLPLIYIFRYSPIFFSFSETIKTSLYLLGVIATFYFGNLQYAFIENKFRIRQNAKLQKSSYIPIGVMQFSVVFLTCFSLLMINFNYFGLNKNIPIPINQADADPNCKRESFSGGGCFYPYKESQRTALLIGDSHAGHLSQAFVDAASAKGWNALVWSQPSCHIIFNGALNKEMSQSCLDRNDLIEAWIKKNHPDLVLVSQFLYGNASQTDMRRTLKEIANTSGKVVVAGNNPSFPDAKTFMVQRPLLMSFSEPRKWFLPSEMFLGDVNASNDMLQWATENGIQTVDLVPLFCSKNRCTRYLDGNWLYRDDDHFSLSASSLIASKLKQIF
jgi:peptidoglycan/LPS O-acetylase OafA/YrhL